MNCIGKSSGVLLLLGGLGLTWLAVSGQTAAQNPSELQRESETANRHLTARLAAAEAALAQSRATAAELQQQLAQLQAERDKNLASVVQLTDQLHKAFGEVQRLKAENARLTAWLPPPPAKGLEGVVTAIQKDGVVEISLGSDDGLKPGHQLSVCRAENNAMRVLGQVVVVSTAPDKSVCRTGFESVDGAVQQGDRITTGKQPAPPSSAEPPKTDEPPFLVGGLVLAVLEDGQVEISFGKAAGLRPGHHLEIYRQTGSQGIYVGRLEVVQVGPEKSRCKIVAEQDTVRKGDRITSKL